MINRSLKITDQVSDSFPEQWIMVNENILTTVFSYLDYFFSFSLTFVFGYNRYQYSEYL